MSDHSGKFHLAQSDSRRAAPRPVAGTTITVPDSRWMLLSVDLADHVGRAYTPLNVFLGGGGLVAAWGCALPREPYLIHTHARGIEGARVPPTPSTAMRGAGPGCVNRTRAIRVAPSSRAHARAREGTHPSTTRKVQG